MTENKRYEFDKMNGGGYVVGYSERMSDNISFFTRLCEVPTKTQAEKVCNELKGLQKEIEQLKSEKQAIIDILDEMENGDDFWDRDYLIDRISDIEIAIGVDLDD